MTGRRTFLLAVLASALSSLGNITVTVAVARATTPGDFGRFAVAMTCYMLVTGVIRAAILEYVLARRPDRQMEAAGLLEALGFSVLLGLLTAVVGWLIAWPVLVIIGLLLPGLELFDYVRTVLLTRGNPGRACFMELGWTLGTIAVAVALDLGFVPVEFALAGWGIVAALIGLLVGPGFFRGIPLSRPGKLLFKPLYALDFCVGTGSTPLSMNFLAASSSPAVVGALRGGATLLGPINLVTAALRPVMIARFGGSEDRSPRSALRIAIALGLCAVPFAAFIVLMPNEWGTALLGASWAEAESVRLPLAIEAILGLLTGVAFAAHRAYEAGGRILLSRSCIALLRVLALTVAGSFFGLVGAAWAIPAVTLIGVAWWWASFIQLARSRERAQHA